MVYYFCCVLFVSVFYEGFIDIECQKGKFWKKFIERISKIAINRYYTTYFRYCFIGNDSFNSSSKRSNYLSWIFNLCGFYLIITAFINVFKYRHQTSPILSASKFINLTVAMISMLSLEVAMIYQFGDQDEVFRQTMVACTGFVIVIINSILAISMIAKANKNLK